jgi:hypothetical protein
MEEDKKEVRPTFGEYQGKPIIRIPTVDAPNPDTPWHWMSFGKNKAKAIVKWIEEIRKFAESSE